MLKAATLELSHQSEAELYNIKAASSKLFHSLCCIIIELYRSLLSCSTAKLFAQNKVSLPLHCTPNLGLLIGVELQQ